MRNKNDYRNQSYQQDWNQGDQGYDRNRKNQNWSQRSSNDRGSRQWQNTGGDWNTGGSYNQDWNRQNDPYSYEQNTGAYERNYDPYRRENYRENDWNEENENRNYNRNLGGESYGSGYRNYGSDYRNNPNRGERNWWDKTTDEVSSWFGDEDAERRRRMDKLSGPHRGKGPKGYTRSDERIKEDINEKLYHDSFVDASNIEITVTDGEATLSGTVDSRETKRRAEDLAESVTGVKNVQNQLRVDTSSTVTGSGSVSSQEGDQYNGRKKSSLLR